MKIKLKRGISFIALLITILVMMLLTSIVVVGVKNSIDNATIVDFMNDMQKIEEAVANYKLMNGQYPIYDNDVGFTQIEVLANTDADLRAILREEMVKNDDYTVEGKNKFFTLDITKIDITQTKRGVKKDEKDIFLISETTGKVYYLKGVSVKNQVYFSITDKAIKTYKIS